jgi:hypothetical protein
MHKYQAQIPGTEDDTSAATGVWWQVCTPVYYQS